ncbi:MAG: hypothetical protein IIZ73_04815 [Ruminococcus sp.]|nr:hypothetical protein [Ruminococcus sp.]
MLSSEIKEMLKNEKIPYWKIADALGVHENTIVRKLRHELSDVDRERFENAIAEIKANKKPSE